MPDPGRRDFDGMILAAGLGTRLRPLTADRPKALVTVHGEAMLGRIARRLVDAGAGQLVINTHHFAEQIVQYVEQHEGAWGVPVRLSHEAEAPRETGGGLAQARHLFRPDRPVLVHNVDVVTDADLAALIQAHVAGDVEATLAVKARDTTRRLLFDDRGLLGREDDTRSLRRLARTAVGTVVGLPFSGIHVASPRLVATLREDGAFGIFDAYLAAVETGAVLAPWRMDASAWFDMGKPEGLAQAEAFLRSTSAT